MPVNSYQKDIAAMLPRFEAIRDVLGGSRRVKGKCLAARRQPDGSYNPIQAFNETYLPQLPGHEIKIAKGKTVDMYADYLRRAVLLPFARPLVSRLLGLMFRKAPTFTVPESVNDHLSNITLSAPAQTAEQFAKCVGRENLTMGHGAIMVDWDAGRARPYQRLYAAGTIVGVRWGLVGSLPMVTQVRLKECAYEATKDDPYVEEEVEQIRVLELSTDAPITPEQRSRVEANDKAHPFGWLSHQIYRRAEDQHGKRTGEWKEFGDPVVPLRMEAPLGFIPLVPFNPFRLSWDLESPPIEDLVELVLADFLLSADYYDFLHACSAGSFLFLRMIGGAAGTDSQTVDTMAVGGGSVVDANHESATAEYVQTSGEAEAAFREARKGLREEMRVALGRILGSDEKNVAESGASLELQFSGDDANLQQIGGTVAMALEEAMKIHVWWVSAAAETPDQVQDVSVDLSDSFLQRPIASQELMSEVTALESDLFTDEDRFHRLKTREALAPTTTFEQWMTARRRTREGAGGFDLGEVRTALATALKALAAGDQGRAEAAVRSIEVLVGEGDQMPAVDDELGGAA